MNRMLEKLARIAPVAALLMGLTVPGRSNAAFTVTLTQVGNDVLASGTGSLNLTGLTIIGPNIDGQSIRASVGSIEIGSTDFVYVYRAYLSSNAGFGADVSRSADSGTGFHVGILAVANNLYLSQTYTSGTVFTATSTFAGTTIAGLGLTAGTTTYAYSATQGGPVIDTFTIQVGPAASVPEPSSGLLCVIAGLAGVAARSTRRRRTH